MIKLQCSTTDQFHHAVDHHIAWTGVKGQDRVDPAAAREVGHVADTSEVLHGASPLLVTEQQIVGVRHQRRSMPACGHVPDAKVTHHGYPEALRDHGRLSDLQRRPPAIGVWRNVIHSLAGRRDQVYLVRPQVRRGNGRRRRLREERAQAEVERTDPLHGSRGRREQREQFLAVLRRIGNGDTGDDLGAGPHAGSTHADHGGVDPVRRRSGHEPHNDLGVRGPQGGPVSHDRVSGPSAAARCSAARTAPSAPRSSVWARSRPTPARAMTIAVFTSPPARVSQIRASSGEQSTA